MHRGMFTHHIHNKYQIRDSLHIADTGKVGLQALDLAINEQAFLLGEAFDLTGLVHAFQFFKLLDTIEHGRPVGEHAAQPALGHVGHAAANGFFCDGFLRLSFGAHEQDVPALGGCIAHQVVSSGEQLDSLLQVDDMDAVALGEDIRAHQRIPFICAVTKMDAAFQQGLHGNDRTHGVLLLCVLSSAFFSLTITAYGSTQVRSDGACDSLRFYHHSRRIITQKTIV